MPDTDQLSPGFAETIIETTDVRFSVLSNGYGPAVLFLHGYPGKSAKRMIQAPVLKLLEAGRLYSSKSEPLDIWPNWTSDAEGAGLAGDHRLTEAASEQVRERIQDFFGRIGYGV